MNVYYLSPIGKVTPDLFSTFKETLLANGHSETENLMEATVIFCDLYSGVGTWDTELLNAILEYKLPIVYFDSSDYGGCKDGTDTWFYFNEQTEAEPVWQSFIRLAAYNCKVVYFMRKMDKTITNYPKWVFPYELLMYLDHVFTPANKLELFTRPIDITFIGNTSPTRLNVIEALKKTDLSLNISFTNETGKFDHPQWLDLHEMSKLFLSACGGGFGDERSYQLMYISPMLRVKNNQLIVHNFRDGIDCVEISEQPTFDEINYLKKVLNDEDLLFQIYQSGIERMEKYFNHTYRTNCILKTLKDNGIC